jgi:hypothetical protein
MVTVSVIRSPPTATAVHRGEGRVKVATKLTEGLPGCIGLHSYDQESVGRQRGQAVTQEMT